MSSTAWRTTWPAWLVHAYTASGGVMALVAARAVAANRYREAFAWLFLAALVDATDGALARIARVNERTPGFDGRRLDDIVDYLTFVFVPAFILVRAPLLPDAAAPWLAAAVLLSSAYGFGRVDAKTADNLFTGFPSYWNVVALYLYAARLPASANAAVVAFVAVMVFVPIRYVYPSRTRLLRHLTLTLNILWGAAVAAIIWQLPASSRVLLWGSAIFPVYYAALSFALTARRRQTTGASERL